MAEKPFIPFHRPAIGHEEMQAVQRVLASRWLTTGPVTQEFEHQFAAFVGCKYALAVNSATAALQLSMDSIGVRPGDEVLVPTYTFTATAAVVIHAGARPVFCDSMKSGFNLCPDDAERRITARTKAVVAVHIAGQPCDLERIQQLATKYGLHVIEDAAHALPASHNGKRVGAISELTAFSFYATKTISTGEGGMLTTDNEEFAVRAAKMRLHGISGDAWKRYSKEGSWSYDVQYAGYKMNMCDVLAAIGCAQLAKCERFWERRHAIAKFYSEKFSCFEGLQVPASGQCDTEHSWHLYILRIRPEVLALTRNNFIEELKKRAIGTSVHFIPLHLHSFYARKYGYNLGDFPNAEDAYSRCISLPIFPDMTDEEVERVVSGVKDVVEQKRIRSLAVA
jgi:dTDP-4-amino-4,6-dideoxygalactose transaminase